ncbi:acyltransferase family protein [Paenarthrobacter sp. DKR-5]|uniref:acyltransferase family protein n=1 Tax=Paenarthrobacter sp. DKR-5 TaxID=2835535 RepID=UPI002027C220|nr:acyltransferase family protein [Paenarthrobacter sp. DKR-5]
MNLKTSAAAAVDLVTPAPPRPRPTVAGAAQLVRAAGRDRYLDLLRAIALVRVVAYHTFASAGWLSIAFPSMGVMFALAGSLMARSLERPTLGVLKSRSRRLLLPLWVYSGTVLFLLAWEGWTPSMDPGATPLNTLLWFLPIGDVPFPSPMGSDAGLVDSTWAQQAQEILWYIRAYFWFMLLSPLLLKAFRRAPLPTMLAPLALLGVITTGILPLPDWSVDTVTDFATFGACWMLGFAHYLGQLRRLPLVAVAAAGAIAMVLGFVWAANNLPPEGWDFNNIPLAQALWSLGFAAILMRISPSWSAFPQPLRFLNKPVTLINNRAMTIYLWHNLLLVITVVLINRLYNDEFIAAHFAGVLDSEWFQFITVWVMLALLFPTIGWVEDVAAKRPAQLWPTGSGKPPAKRPAAEPAPAAVPAAAAVAAAAAPKPRTVAPAAPRRQALAGNAYHCVLNDGVPGSGLWTDSHEGRESVHVLKGRLRLVLGSQDRILEAGESAEFDARELHWFGQADKDPVEFIGLFDGEGAATHATPAVRLK